MLHEKYRRVPTPLCNAGALRDTSKWASSLTIRRHHAELVVVRVCDDDAPRGHSATSDDGRDTHGEVKLRRRSGTTIAAVAFKAVAGVCCDRRRGRLRPCHLKKYNGRKSTKTTASTRPPTWHHTNAPKGGHGKNNAIRVREALRLSFDTDRLGA